MCGRSAIGACIVTDHWQFIFAVIVWGLIVIGYAEHRKDQG